MNTPLLFDQLTIFEMNGKDARPFLKNQIISTLPENDDVIYTVICNPKGRILYSLFIFSTPNGFLVAVNNDLSDNFFHYISLRKFRMDFEIKKTNFLLLVDITPKPEVSSQSFHLTENKTAHTVATQDEFWQLIFALELPWIIEPTSELFIPQHVNLDQKNIIAFDKGCYPGQEIIARLHYIGKVKKRMQLLTTKEPLENALGQTVMIDGMSEKVEICSPSVNTKNGWQVQVICGA